MMVMTGLFLKISDFDRDTLSLNSFLRVRTPSSCYWGRLRQKTIAQSLPPPHHVTRVAEVLTVTHKLTCMEPKQKNRHINLFSFLSRCEGAGEHSEGSVVRPPRRGAQKTPPLLLLVCCYCNGGHWWRWRRRCRRRQCWSGERRKPGEWSSQRSHRSWNQEDEPARLCVHQSSGKRKLWKGKRTTLDISCSPLFSKFVLLFLWATPLSYTFTLLPVALCE